MIREKGASSRSAGPGLGLPVCFRKFYNFFCLKMSQNNTGSWSLTVSYTNYGALLVKLGRLEEAERCYKKCEELDPNDAVKCELNLNLLTLFYMSARFF